MEDVEFPWMENWNSIFSFLFFPWLFLAFLMLTKLMDHQGRKFLPRLSVRWFFCSCLMIFANDMFIVVITLQVIHYDCTFSWPFQLIWYEVYILWEWCLFESQSKRSPHSWMMVALGSRPEMTEMVEVVGVAVEETGQEDSSYSASLHFSVF